MYYQVVLNWLPIFISGTGDAAVTMPEGAGHVLPKGTQLTVQLHLLNATPEKVTETIPLGLRRAPSNDVEPVGAEVFVAKTTCDLNVAVVAGHHHDLLVELR